MTMQEENKEDTPVEGELLEPEANEPDSEDQAANRQADRPE